MTTTNDTLYLIRRLLSNRHTLSFTEFVAELEKIHGEAAPGVERTAGITFSGRLVAIGDLQQGDLPVSDGHTVAAVMERGDGSRIALVGLTRQECMSLSDSFMGPVSVAVAPRKAA